MLRRKMIGKHIEIIYSALKVLIPNYKHIDTESCKTAEGRGAKKGANVVRSTGKRKKT